MAERKTRRAPRPERPEARDDRQMSARAETRVESGATTEPQETIIFEPTGQPVRRVRRDGEWYYAVEDLLEPTPDRPDHPDRADERGEDWADVRARLRADGMRQVDARIVEVELLGEDGAARPTRVASAATLLRLLEAISGPAAEAAKEWLARAGAERLREEEDPAIAIERARKLYARQGYPRDWTQRRLHGITLRQRLAQEWAARGAREGADYAALTDALSQGTFGMPVEAHKAAKGLKTSQSLRDSMTNMELLLMNLVEETALTMSQARDSQGVEALLHDTQEASAIGGATRQAIEARIGRTLVTPANFRALRQGQARRSRVYLGPPLRKRPAETQAAEPPAQAESQPASEPAEESEQRPAPPLAEQPPADATIM